MYPLSSAGDPPSRGYPPSGGYPPLQGSHHAGSYPPPQPQSFLPAGGYPPPVSQQPTSRGHPPASEDGRMRLPPALEYLTSIDQLLVHRKIKLLEVKFIVKNKIGQKVFYAVQQCECCTCNCCDPIRLLKILDNYNNEVIHLERSLASDSCCCPCCLQKMKVYAPPGCLVGSVEQEWSFCSPVFSIKNAAGDTVLRIQGINTTTSCCSVTQSIKVMSTDGSTVVGRITKRETPDDNSFGITFPMDFDVRMKAVMLGACFFIDKMVFEMSRDN